MEKTHQRLFSIWLVRNLGGEVKTSPEKKHIQVKKSVQATTNGEYTALKLNIAHGRATNPWLQDDYFPFKARHNFHGANC